LDRTEAGAVTTAAGQRGSALDEEAAWDDWLSTATDAQLACRDARHMWEPSRVNYHSEGQAYEVTEECGRACGTTRTRWVSGVDGQTIGWPAYSYAEGFLAKGSGVFGSQHRGAARLARVKRLHATRARWGRK
jgi:hypothetical protein